MSAQEAQCGADSDDGDRPSDWETGRLSAEGGNEGGKEGGQVGIVAFGEAFPVAAQSGLPRFREFSAIHKIQSVN